MATTRNATEEARQELSGEKEPALKSSISISISIISTTSISTTCFSTQTSLEISTTRPTRTTSSSTPSTTDTARLFFLCLLRFLSTSLCLLPLFLLSTTTTTLSAPKPASTNLHATRIALLYPLPQKPTSPMLQFHQVILSNLLSSFHICSFHCSN